MDPLATCTKCGMFNVNCRCWHNVVDFLYAITWCDLASLIQWSHDMGAYDSNVIPIGTKTQIEREASAENGTWEWTDTPNSPLWVKIKPEHIWVADSTRARGHWRKTR